MEKEINNNIFYEENKAEEAIVFNDESEEFDTKQPLKSKKLWIFLLFILVPLVIILSLVTYAVIVNYYSSYSGPGRDYLRKIPLISRSLNYQQTKKVRKNIGDKVRRVLDGVYVEKGSENLSPVAVVIDNHPDAQPLAGIAEAQLVYEAPVEGGITRYLTIFASDNTVGQIGPVRSARPYFVDWVNELSACFSHCGGSPEALAKISKENIIDMNEFYNGDYFWRASDRKAPHNIITSLSNLYKYADQKGLEGGKYFSWSFKDDEPLSNRPASTTKIIIPEFGVFWEYNLEDNDYTRYLNNSKHKDALGLEIKSKNIVLLYTDMKVIDELLRLKIITIGEGKAVICQDGICTNSEWRKKSPSSRTRFFREEGSEFIFNAGTTWIEVVGNEYDLSY